MRDREPVNVKTFAMLHNLILFLLSLYMAVECWRQSVANFGRPSPRLEGAAGFRLFCNPNDAYSPDGGDTFSPSGLALARVLYVHYISKVLRALPVIRQTWCRSTGLGLLQAWTRQCSEPSRPKTKADAPANLAIHSFAYI